MPHQSRTPAEAVERYRGRVVRLLSCVTSAHTTVSGWLAKVHLPTGAIELEDIVALTISDLGVEPLREDWERVLREDQSR